MSSSNSGIHVRSAIDADASIIVQWQIAMAHETENMTLDEVTVRKGVQHIFESPEVGSYYIAEVDHMPVASTLILQEWSDWRCGNVLWIHSVYVEPHARRRGVFSAIYKHLKAKVAADESLRGLRLYVDKSNLPAQAVYQRLGMNGDHYQTFEWMK